MGRTQHAKDLARDIDGLSPHQLPGELLPASARFRALAQLSTFFQSPAQWQTIIENSMGIARYMQEQGRQNPGVVLAAAQAQAGDPSIDGFEIAGAAAKTAEIVKWRRVWDRSDEQQRQHLWKTLKDSEKDQLRQTAGFQEPPPESLGGRIFGGIDTAIVEVGEAVSSAAGATLRASMVPLKAVADGFKTVHYVATEGATEDLSENFFERVTRRIGNIFSTKNYAEGWRASREGTYLPYMDGTEFEDLPDHARPAAFDFIIGGATEEELLAKYDQNTIAELMTNQGRLSKVAENLDKAQWSPGRMTAYFLGVERDSDAFTWVSGAGDAIFTMASDPLLRIGKVAKSWRATRYMVKGGGAAFDVVARRPAVQRLFNAVAGRNIDETLRLMPKLADNPVVIKEIQTAIKKGAWSTPDDVHKVFRDLTGTLASAEGAGAKLGQLPRMSRLGSVLVSPRLGAGNSMDSLIAWARREPQNAGALGKILRGGKSFMGITAAKTRGLTKMAPRGLKLHLDDAGNFRRLAQVVHTSDNVARQMGLWHSADRMGRANLVRSLLSDTFDTLRVNDTSKLRFLKAFDDSIERTFIDNTGKQVSALTDNLGRTIHAPVAPWMADEMAEVVIPNLQEVARASFGTLRYQWLGLAKLGIKGHTVAGGFSALNDRLFTPLLKPLMLLSGGYAIRNAGEEWFGHVVREGWTASMRSKLALRAALPRDIRKAIRKGKPLTAAQARYAQGSRVAMHAKNTIEKTMGPQKLDYDTAARMMMDDYGHLMEVDVMNSGRVHGGHNLSDVSVRRALEDGVSLKEVGLKAPSGRGIGAGAVDDWYQTLHKNMGLDHAGNLTDPLSRDIFLAGAGASNKTAARAAIRKVLQTEDGKKFLKKAGLEGQSLDRVVARMQEYQWGVTRSVGGRPVPGLMKKLRKGELPDPDDLANLSDAQRPKIYASTFAVPGGKDGMLGAVLESGISKGFHFLGKIMNRIAREPIAVHEYAVAMKNNEWYRRALLKKGFNTLQADELMKVRVRREAIDKIKEFIDQPDVRTQFAAFSRGVIPFMNAQEQFLRRWAKTFIPGVGDLGTVEKMANLRRLELTMHGLEDIGMVYETDDGQKMFLYPGLGLAGSALVNAVALLKGREAYVPKIRMGGGLSFVAAGLDAPFRPGLHPFIAWGINTAQTMHPPLNSFANFTLGEYSQAYEGPGDFWRFIVPPTLRKGWEAMAPDEHKMSSLEIKVIQQMMADGRFPNPAAYTNEAGELDSVKFNRAVDDARDQARTAAWAYHVVGVAMGIAGPVKPRLEVLDDLTPELFAMIKHYGFDDGLNRFLKKNPYALGHTVFQSMRQPGMARLDPSQLVGNWIDDNGSLIRDYKSAPDGGISMAALTWLMPYGPREGVIEFKDGRIRNRVEEGFDRHAWQWMMKVGLKQKRTPDEFVDQFRNQIANNLYYQMRDERDSYLESLHPQDPARKWVTDNWRAWQKGFDAENPSAAAARQRFTSDQREGVISALRDILDRPDRPKSIHEDSLREVITLYDHFSDQIQTLSGQRSTQASDTRRAIRQAFLAKVATFGPVAYDFYNSVISGLDGLNEEEELAAGLPQR